jgi:DNA anti-recombination protein RmuC
MLSAFSFSEDLVVVEVAQTDARKMKETLIDYVFRNREQEERYQELCDIFLTLIKELHGLDSETRAKINPILNTALDNYTKAIRPTKPMTRAF